MAKKNNSYHRSHSYKTRSHGPAPVVTIDKKKKPRTRRKALALEVENDILNSIASLNEGVLISEQAQHQMALGLRLRSRQTNTSLDTNQHAFFSAKKSRGQAIALLAAQQSLQTAASDVSAINHIDMQQLDAITVAALMDSGQSDTRCNSPMSFFAEFGNRPPDGDRQSKGSNVDTSEYSDASELDDLIRRFVPQAQAVHS